MTIPHLVEKFPHLKVVLAMEKYVDDLERKYPNPEPSNAVDLVNEGRRRNG
jgi:hypothetical protein